MCNGANKRVEEGGEAGHEHLREIRGDYPVGKGVYAEGGKEKGQGKEKKRWESTKFLPAGQDYG